MHDELDRHERRTAAGILGGDQQCVAVHASSETEGIEGEMQLGRRDAVAGTDGEPLLAEPQAHAPGERALPRVRDGDAIGARCGTARGRSSADVCRRTYCEKTDQAGKRYHCDDANCPDQESLCGITECDLTHHSIIGRTA